MDFFTVNSAPFDEKTIAGSPATQVKAPQNGLITFSIPPNAPFRKIYLYMEVALNTSDNAYIVDADLVFKLGGSLVSRLPATFGKDLYNAGSGIHVLDGKSRLNRFGNSQVGGRDAAVLSFANPQDLTNQQAVITPAFHAVQADVVELNLNRLAEWYQPTVFCTPLFFRAFLQIESSALPY